jgi:hypothetical protein
MGKFLKGLRLVGVAGLGSVIGFLIAQVVSYWQFSKTLTNTNRIEQIHLLRDLNAEFSGKDSDPAFKRIRTGITSCQRLYSGDLGLARPPQSQAKYDYDQINRYLGLFDEIGFYQSQRALELSQIDHLFGAVIIEAYEYKELRLSSPHLSL